MKLLAIDGNSIINRAFFGVRALSTQSGQPTNAIFGFLNILLKLKKDWQPDQIVFTFDRHAPTFRHKQYDQYKANRKGMPQELFSQMQPLKDILAALGYAIVELDGYEADDLLGTLSRLAGEQGGSCVIATGGPGQLPVGQRHHHRLPGENQGADPLYPGKDPGGLRGSP